MDESFQKMEVSRAQFDLLLQIVFEEGINQQACADRMNVLKGNIAQHIARLERTGRVQRRKEGRTNSLYLNQKGEQTVAEFMPLHDQRVKQILSGLSAEEMTQFQSILRAFDRRLS